MQGKTNKRQFFSMQFRKLSILLFSILLSNIFLFARDPKQLAEATDTIKSIYLPPLRKVIADSVINYGKLFLNTPYQYGACGISNFDCSGFTSHVFRNFGYNLNRSSSEQAQQFPSIDKKEIKPGDLVFFNGRSRNGRVGHVGIVTEAHQGGDFDFIHASVSGGVIVSNSSENYYQRRYVKAVRVLLSDSLLHVALTPNPIKREEFVSVTPAQKVKKTIPAVYHLVKSGENLTLIAKQYGMTVAELKNKNNLKQNKINTKQRLMIKEAEQFSIMEPMTAQSKVSINKDSINKIEKSTIAESKVTIPTKHLIKRGETLFSIAKLYQINVDELKKLNKLTDTKIVPGKELTLSVETNTLSAENEVKISLSTVAINEDKKVKVETETPKLATEHRVRKDETLSSISKKYNLTTDQLKTLNGLVTNKITVNQVLKVESEQLAIAETSTSTKSVSQTPKEPKELTKHKVSNGESLYSIAKKYKVKVDDLIDYNHLSSSNIQKGQNIRIPKI